MFDKKKVCPQCSYVGNGIRFCEECGANIENVAAREMCWIVVRACGVGFSACAGRYESLEALIDKAGPISKLVQNWLVLVFLDEIAVGKTLTAQKQRFVTSDRILRDVDLKAYKLVE